MQFTVQTQVELLALYYASRKKITIVLKIGDLFWLLLCSELKQTATCDKAIYIVFLSKELSIRSGKDSRCSNHGFVQ